MRVAIIGAGVAGLATAKVLRQAGHEVVVFDKTPDVGGVWSRTRRYPGLTTQSPKAQYSLSDYPMPKSYPQWPSGQQVQAYLEQYAAHFGLDDALRLNTEVAAARPAGDGWILDTRDCPLGWGAPAPHPPGGGAAGGVTSTDAFDRLVVANGVFCDPAIPAFHGREEFAAAGGALLAGTEFHDAEQARDKARARDRLRQVRLRRHLPAEVQSVLLDERGNFLLYRQIRPADVPGLYFNGYNSSFFSPLNAEMAAVWIAADLAGLVPLPDAATVRRAIAEQLAFMDDATNGHHCRGTKIIPFSMHNVDEVLGDLGLNIGPGVRASHWINPINPAAYRHVTPALVRRLGAAPARPKESPREAADLSAVKSA